MDFNYVAKCREDQLNSIKTISINSAFSLVSICLGLELTGKIGDSVAERAHSNTYEDMCSLSSPASAYTSKHLQMR